MSWIACRTEIPGHLLLVRYQILHCLYDDATSGITGDRIVLRLDSKSCRKALAEVGNLRITNDVRCGNGGIPTFDRGEPGAGEEVGALDSVAARLDNVGQDVIGLLRQLHAGLINAAIIECLWIEALDLGKYGGVIGGLWVESVASEHLDAVLLGLLLERVREPTP